MRLEKDPAGIPWGRSRIRITGRVRQSEYTERLDPAPRRGRPGARDACAGRRAALEYRPVSVPRFGWRHYEHGNQCEAQLRAGSRSGVENHPADRYQTEDAGSVPLHRKIDETPRYAGQSHRTREVWD